MATTPSIVSIIQARLSSSRLPGKVLMPLGGATVLDQVIARAQTFSRQVVVCTSIDRSDDPIEQHCEARGIVCVRGPLDDVFWRYRMALADPRVERSEWFARVTGDCPLLSTQLAAALVDEIAAEPGLDYVRASHDALPRGLTIELVRRTTFESINPAALDLPEREHVTLHLYETAGRYRCRIVEPPASLRHPQLRLTLDYEEDYALLERLFERDPALSAERAIEILLAEPELARINAHCEQKAARPAAPSELQPG